MKNKKNILLALLLTVFAIEITPISACTIFSGKDKNGHTWAGNNEDYLFTFNTYMNLVKATNSTFGYIYFTYGKLNTFIQGGVNEAGLFFDFNAVPPSTYKDYKKKESFPGGNNEMLQYILKKCESVQEVLVVFKKYRLRGMEASQMHLADRYGNLGVIVADSMWVTPSPYQISTNYNLCHPDKDGQTCWRFPIAEQVLKMQEPGLESFRQICSATSQSQRTSTIYSNIHDLTTGDIWIYYAMNYDKPYKTNINELLKRGNSFFLIYELFADEPLVEVYKTYQSAGAEAGIQKLNSYQLPLERKNGLLRLLTFDLIVLHHDFKSYPFLSDLIALKKEEADELLKVINAMVLFCTGKKTEGLNLLNNYLVTNPKALIAPLATNLMSQMQHITNKEAERQGKTCKNCSLYVENLYFKSHHYAIQN